MYTYTSEVKWLTTVFVEKSDKVLFHFSFYQQTYMTLTNILFLALSLSLSLSHNCSSIQNERSILLYIIVISVASNGEKTICSD